MTRPQTDVSSLKNEKKRKIFQIGAIEISGNYQHFFPFFLQFACNFLNKKYVALSAKMF